jgi:hypothetical protein
VFWAEDFIVVITEHIPDKYFQNIRYCGWYSNKSRGLRAKQGRCCPGIGCHFFKEEI